MKKAKKRWIYLILLVGALCFMQTSVVQANSMQGYDGGISVMYIQSNRCRVNLRFSGTKANCTLTVTGKKGTTKISGTLKLYDSTSLKTVKSWSISKIGSAYSGTKTATVKKGHRYKLSFSGKVYADDSKYGESVSSSTSKKN